MRIVAIGLGGAGCRIVDSLFATDRKSSKVACIQGLAIDVDETTLKQLGSLPDSAKIFFPSLDPGTPDESGDNHHTATIDIGEIISRVQNFESGETDAVVICCGLGGSMVNVAPHIISALRSTIVEPIFGLITLPCLAEGEKRSEKAADDIDILSPLLDGIILFDNETWYRKIKATKATLVKKDKGFSERLGFRKGEPEISAELATYLLLNEAIVRRISLIMRAGEFKADGGIDLAEVVLDSGEVLNTMKGMGFITIGYAVERLPHNPLGFLSRWRPTGIFGGENKKKASRIVELAKQAIYHEISTPCDMTSAHKALILVAGPSHEISMKGFMTVRKWIDRSIAGLETRSGDYPVMNTKNVAIIIMLSGLENIPRINEIREIRSQQKSRKRGDSAVPVESLTKAIPQGIDKGEALETKKPLREDGRSKDEMIALPKYKHKGEGADASAHKRGAHPTGELHSFKDRVPSPTSSDVDFSSQDSLSDSGTLIKKPSQVLTKKPHVVKETASLVTEEEVKIHQLSSPLKKRSKVFVTRGPEEYPESSSMHTSPSASGQEPFKSQKIPQASGQGYNQPDEKHGHYSSDYLMRNKETERHRIEKELQRQRIVAISGHPLKSGPGLSKNRIFTPDTGGLKREDHTNPPTAKSDELADHDGPVHTVPERKTVIIAKRKSSPPAHVTLTSPEEMNTERPVPSYEETGVIQPGTQSRDENIPGVGIGTIKEPVPRAKDDVFGGKGVQRRVTPQARDSSLIHTNIKQKKTADESRNDEAGTMKDDQGAESPKTSKKPDKKNTSQDDISWI